MIRFISLFSLIVSLFVVAPLVLSPSATARDLDDTTVSDERPQKIGLFAGTLDPTHASHTRIVKQAIGVFGLDIVYILANLESPHKPDASPYALRKEMAEAAFLNVKEARFPDARLEEAYKDWDIIDVVHELMGRHPGDHILHIMGSDAVTRYGDKFEEEFAVEDSELTRYYNMIINVREKGDEKFLPQSYGLVEVLPMVVPQKKNVSSTDIRNAIIDGEIPEGVHPRVLEIMHREGLYQPSSNKSKCVKSVKKLS